MNELTSIDGPVFRRRVRRLAPYMVFSAHAPNSGESNTEAIRRQFVLAAAHENQGSLDSCARCREVCQEKWGIDLDADEISVAIKQLVKEDKLVGGSTRIVLTDACTQELAKRIRGASEVEALALGEWELALRKSVPSLGDEQVAQLRDDLIAWIQQIIVERGTEAAVVLYPEQACYKHRLDEIKALGFSSLPARDPTVTLIRPAALKTFLDCTTVMQRCYFDNLMSTAYLMSAFTLEPAAFDELRKLISGQRIYLDTNVVYALLKLHGPRVYARTVSTLNHSRLLGYEICVTPWTVAEMRKSVKTAHRRYQQKQSRRASSDYVGNSTTSDEHELFVEAYRRMQRDTGTNPRDFFALYEQVEGLLIDERVTIASDGCWEIDEDDSHLDEQIALLERARNGEQKLRPVLEHDVKHRLLVEKHRGGRERRPSDMDCLVVTNDHGLIRYAAYKPTGEMPFAVSFAEWASRVRHLIPRTDDYEKTMADIFQTLSLQMPGLVSQSAIIDAIDQIRFQEEHSSNLGVRMLLDTPLSDDDDAVSEDYERLRSVTSAREGALEVQVLGLEEQLAVLREVLAVESRALIDAERNSESTATPYGPMQEPSNVQGSASANELTRNDAIRWIASSWIAFVGVLVLVIPLSAGWITGGTGLTGDICAAGGVWIGAFTLLRGWKLANAIVTLIASITAIWLAVDAIVG